MAIDRQIEKASRLVEYLIRLTDLQRKSIKDLANYEQVLWFHEVPQLKGCFTPAWGADQDVDDSVWLEAQTRREPALPKIPKVCADWVNPAILRTKTEMPLLHETITRQLENLEWSEESDEPQFLYEQDELKNHPEVQEKWDRYLEEQWIPWTEDHNDWASVQAVYSKLFTIYQEQLKLGEQFELIVGTGLLVWQTPESQQIYRHLLVATAALEFESKLGKFTVRPNPDGADLRVELDMLESTQPPKAEELARNGLVAAEDNPWVRGVVDGVLEGLVHSIDSKGEFFDRLKAETPRTIEKPVLEYAPALILRKRSARGLTETLKKMKDQVLSGAELPVEFKDVAEIYQAGIDEIEQDDRPFSDDRGGEAKPVFDEEIYFPKPSNREQRQIIERLSHSNGVLVQGPPGTGKSHTIANLICHLLASGKRILVTAKTPRALQVIERQLPPHMRPLCVNLLGGGTEERQALENSMGAVLRKTQTWNSSDSKARQTDMTDRLQTLREEKAVLEKRICAIRESETHAQTIVDGCYSGTAIQIVRQVQGEKPNYSWLTDKVHFETACPLDASALTALLNGLRKLSEEKRMELAKIWPEKLSDESEVKALFSAEESLMQDVDNLSSSVNQSFFEQLDHQNNFSPDSVLKELSTLQDILRSLWALPYGWVETAIREVTAGHETVWKEIHSSSETSLTAIASFIDVADRADLGLPGDLDKKQILADAEKLHAILADGSHLGWGPFCSSAVRPLRHIAKKISVNGQMCKSIESLDLLVKSLRVDLEMDALWSLWRGKVSSVNGPYKLQYHEIKAHVDALGQVIAARKQMCSCQSAIYGWFREIPIAWDNTELLSSLVQSCRMALAKAALQEKTAKIQTMFVPARELASNLESHPVVSEILQAVQDRNIDRYNQCARQIEELSRSKSLMSETDSAFEKLANDAPEFSEKLQETAADAEWDNRLSDFSKAWNWARARYWIEDYINKEDLASLNSQLSQVDGDINFTLEILSAEKAWAFCFSRMTESHRRHMEAWQQHIKKLGKGTGKHAPFHRREAQANLNECREAVPAWVMPLHRVWDTVSPSPGMFDVIIVDEASQCGLESLPLFYMAKKILVVGDDKQISPAAVGVPRDSVHRLMDEFLYDFKFKTNAFDVTTSLFDQAKLRYSTHKVVLREHFRCMPEIIRFSNDLCYTGEPLIPLRQYGADRLKPLERRFVESGYREGRNNRVINRPEAEAIVETIVELCADPKYEDKTMGVVILQGEAQAQQIEMKLLERLGADEIERRRLICGNPYSFQGDERDIIFLSMVAAPNERIGAYAKASDEQRFNVAASRAKDQMWLFHSATRNDLSQSCCRSKLVAFFEGTKVDPIQGVEYDELEKQVFNSNRGIVKAPHPFDSWFEVDVALELARKKYLVIPQFEVAGKFIDLVVDGGGSRLAVECDGDAFHAAEHYVQDMERQKILERCGWPFFRIRESEFYADKERVLSKLWNVLDQRGILPVDAIQDVEDSLKEDVSDDTDEFFEDAASASTYDFDKSAHTDTSNLCGPEDIHEAMEMPYRDLRDAIIATLERRPHQSCVKDSVIKFLLQYLEIISRGKPREAFAYKVDQALVKMGKKGILKIYIATNERVKLVEEPYLSMALGKDLVN